MKRSAPLQRKPFNRRPAHAAVRPDREDRPMVPLARATVAVRAVMGGVLTGAAPKDPHELNPALRRLARGRPCLLRWRPGCHGEDGSTTVACHENRLSASKGSGYKAHDWRSVWGCVVCHAAFDQPSASLGVTHAMLDAVFVAAWGRQLVAWRGIVENPAERPWARAAAAWALERAAARNLGDK